MNLDILSLTQELKNLHPRERVEILFQHVKEEEVFITSSFGATSIILLHLISKVRPGFPIHFIDTGYNFKETVDYKEYLTEKLNLNIIDVKAEEHKHRFTKQNETWRYNTDLCCYINKVNPVDNLKKNHKVWIAGLLNFQNRSRNNLQLFDQKEDILKFYPIVDMSKDEVALYQTLYDLPVHPLLPKGYSSIGCTHCTIKGSGREGRWVNTAKTECGLHL